MDIQAYKMDGLGNDFVIIDNRSENPITSKQKIKLLKFVIENLLDVISLY